MDLAKIISELKVQLQYLDVAIASMEELARVQNVLDSGGRQVVVPDPDPTPETPPPVKRGRGRPRKNPAPALQESAQTKPSDSEILADNFTALAA
jgi:hypothetical protein